MNYANLPQAVELENNNNTRHFIGYSASDGKTVVIAKLIRSGAPEGFSESDIALLLEKYKIKYVLDIRSTTEIPSPPILGNLPEVAYFNYPMSNKVRDFSPQMDLTEAAQYLIDLYNMAGGTPEAAFQWTVTTYTNTVTVEEFIENTRKIFDVLLQNQDGCVFYNCTGGKDRTGVISMLILTALGVRWETIIEDYLYTNIYMDSSAVLDEVLRITGDPVIVEGVSYFARTHERFLETVKTLLQEKYGSIENYLSRGLGLTTENIAQLRAVYTVEPV
jgi:protein-tyrosine phosphatase